MKVTNVNDYVDKVHSKFPELTKSEVKRILIFGWKQIIQCVAAGNDIQIVTPSQFFFIGNIPNSALSTFKNYCFKLTKRIRYLFKKTNAEWDGYYYFTRSESQYKEYLEQSKRKIKIFKNVFLFKLLEEAKLYNSNHPYIFRLSEDKTSWMSKYYPEIKTKNAELIEVRDALNMKDIMTSQKKYKYLQT